MSSVGSGFKQPVTRNFVMTQKDDGSGQEWGPRIFLQSDIDTFLSNYASDIKVTGGAYIVNNFNTRMDNLNHSGDRITKRNTIIDMGKEYIFGNTTEPRLIVLRKIKVYGLSSEGGMGQVGYIPVEYNVSDDINSYFQVKVARV